MPDKRSGTIWDNDWRELGNDARGSDVRFSQDHDHTSVHGDGWHTSWNTDRDGNVSDVHSTVHYDSGPEVVETDK